MNKIFIAGALLAFFIWQAGATPAFAGSREVIVLGTSQGDVTYRVAVSALPVLSEEGRQVLLQVASSCDPHQYKAYEGAHKRTATYRFAGARDETLSVNGVSSGSTLLVDLLPDSLYRVTAGATFLWELGGAKEGEGFPKYRSTRVTSEPVEIKGTELQAASEEEPEQKMENSKKKEEETMVITGRAEHTMQWEENRIAYNRDAKRKREEDVFWPGEKVLVMAETGGMEVRRVTAEIEGTELRTELLRAGERTEVPDGRSDEAPDENSDEKPDEGSDKKPESGRWEGVLFDPVMRNGKEWQFRDAVICFTAEGPDGKAVDRIRIRFDGSVEYYAMHRKE